ncbi:hypothetical protein SY2F82_35010 [Streptomyces sp. Y2F8-2]|nr:hypothetical protein SY2F82_35010 [Streptomyces sp. Y2F8-2]
MVVPFGSAIERRSRTTYRPTVTPEGSTHVDMFTGTTSSLAATASENLAVAAVAPPTGFCGSSVAEHHGVGVTPVTGREAHVRHRFEHRKTGKQPLTDDLLRRQPPMTSVSTPSTAHPSPGPVTSL